MENKIKTNWTIDGDLVKDIKKDVKIIFKREGIKTSESAIVNKILREYYSR